MFKQPYSVVYNKYVVYKMQHKERANKTRDGPVSSGTNVYAAVLQMLNK